MEEESKEVNVKLDKQSVQILNKVSGIHRISMINLGLALVEKTGYYRTLCGESSKSIEDVLSLDSLGELKPESPASNVLDIVAQPTKKKSSVEW